MRRRRRRCGSRTSAARTGSRGVHVIEGIHYVVVGYMFCVVMLVIIEGLTAVPILHGPFFTFGAPVTVGDAVVTSNVPYAIAVLFLALARAVEIGAAEVRAWAPASTPRPTRRRSSATAAAC